MRLVAIDGSNFEVPDEAANAAAFGYPGSRTGHAGYPQAQCAVLVECASHAILGANLGPYRSAEWAICEPLLSHFDATMLCLADRGFNGYRYWQAARDTGAQLLWRCASNRQLPVATLLADGSYLSVIYPDVKSRRTQQDGITLRVIEYSLPGIPEAQARYRLLTTLLDPERAPALELAALYHQRWEVEAVFDELKTHLQQRRRVLRSKTPEGVRQEFYGWVLAHYAVCWLMYRAADAHKVKQRSLSFTGHVQLMRRAQPRSGEFPPQRAPGCEGAGSMSCCARRRGCAVSVVAAGRNLEWSSDDIHPTPAMFAKDSKAKATTAPRCCLTRCLCQRDGEPRLLSKRTVLGQVLQSHSEGPRAG